MHRFLSLWRARRRVYASPLLTLLAVAIFSVPGAEVALRYVGEVSASDSWRFLTSHWVHWSFEHLVWSGGAFLVLGWVCEGRGRIRFLATTVAAALAIPVALRLWQPGLEAYGGLSGIDSALFGLLCTQEIRKHWIRRDWRWLSLPTIFFGGFLVKLAYEYSTLEAIFVSHTDAMVPVPLAHLVGAAVGVIAAFNLERIFLWKSETFCTRSAS